jgi:TolB-like protein/Tfp pilus assembly protein PilF
LNKAVARLRETLEDSAEQPKFIETLPRQGYRFIAAVERAERRIAVLPFHNKTGSSENEYLSEGISASLISSLSELSKLIVMSRASCFRFSSESADPIVVGRELGVGAIIMGTIALRGEILSISLELVNTTDGSHVWGGRYDRRLAKLAGIEDAIAQDVADKLQLKFGHKKSGARRTAKNSKAFQLYLKGRYHWNKRTTDHLKQGLECFKQAIDSDPGYALAYAGVADSYNMLVWNLTMSAHDGLPKARSAAVKALEIDSKLAEGHAALAFVKLFYEWDWQAADAEFKRTFELKGDYPTAPLWHAMELAALGRFQEAVLTTDRALESDPLSLSINAISGLVFYFMRQPDTALKQCKRTIEIDPNFFASHFVCGLVLEQIGRHEEAIPEFQASVDLSSRLPLFLQGLGHGLAVAGQREAAQAIIAELREASRPKYRSSFAVAVIYAGLGEMQLALEWLEKACDERATWMIFARVHPYFDALQAEPRFQALVRRLRFES